MRDDKKVNQNSRLSVFKEFQDGSKDYAAISTKDDDSDSDFEK